MEQECAFCNDYTLLECTECGKPVCDKCAHQDEATIVWCPDCQDKIALGEMD